MESKCKIFFLPILVFMIFSSCVHESSDSIYQTSEEKWEDEERYVDEQKLLETKHFKKRIEMSMESS